MDNLTANDLRQEIADRETELRENEHESDYLKEQHSLIRRELDNLYDRLDVAESNERAAVGKTDEDLEREKQERLDLARQKRLLRAKYGTEAVASVRDYWIGA